MRTCREHKGNIDSGATGGGGRGPCVRRWATGRAGAPGEAADEAPGGPGQGFLGQVYSQQGQPCSPGGSGPETCAHTLREPGRRESFFRTHLGGEVSPQPLVGSPGLLDKTEAGHSQCPMECRNRLESRQSKTRALGDQEGRCPVAGAASSFSLTWGRGAHGPPHGTCPASSRAGRNGLLGSELRAALYPPGSRPQLRLLSCRARILSMP